MFSYIRFSSNVESWYSSSRDLFDATPGNSISVPFCSGAGLFIQPGQISLPITLSSAPCIFNIHKSSLCFDCKRLQGWKWSPAHRGKKGGGGDITVPVNRKMRKSCCLRILSDNSHKTCQDSNVPASPSVTDGFQLSGFTNSICQLFK